MKKIQVLRILIVLALAASSAASAMAVRVGETAPDFTELASDGHSYKLSDFRGKFVVLEWHNNTCPWTMKHYKSGNMERLQKEWTSKGVIWFTVISSAPGKDGYVTADEENVFLKRMNAVPTAALLDPSGQLGHLYDAKTTPTMVLISSSGVILYYGAIDDRPTTDLADVIGAKNYISEALTEAFAGKPVSVPFIKSYGCAVRYGSPVSIGAPPNSIGSAPAASVLRLGDKVPAGIHTWKTNAGKVVLVDANGMTLYTSARDEEGKSACDVECAKKRPPLIAAADAKPVGDWTVITRDVSSKQWAYKGKALYRDVKDTKPGDITGDAPDNQVWHAAVP